MAVTLLVELMISVRRSLENFKTTLDGGGIDEVITHAFLATRNWIVNVSLVSFDPILWTIAAQKAKNNSFNTYFVSNILHSHF